MSTTKKTVLITGAFRGIGNTLAKLYLEQGWRVIAAARDPSKPSKPFKLEGDVLVVKIDSASLTDAFDAVEELKTKHNITHLDTVIANAAMSPVPSLLASASLSEFGLALTTNVQGPLALFQATRPLLDDEGTFTFLGSPLGCISRDWMAYAGTYGTTKNAINFLAKGLNAEEPKLKVFAISPGWVDSDMGQEGATLAGLEAPPDKIAVTGPNMVKIINEATKEKTGGLLWEHDGTQIPF
ncbi:hypothetical protein IAR50_005238 [Cryptococcus sp. DSM 104548]